MKGPLIQVRLMGLKKTVLPQTVLYNFQYGLKY